MSKYKTRMSDLMLTIESKKALDKKAKKSGMPKSILSKVYDRGMAAWKGGHRPGTTPQQWALARVNSFITKSSGTWGGADKDLAKQVRGEEFDLELEDHLEEGSWEKNKKELPPHLKKLFDKDGNFINPKSQAVFDKMVKDAGGFDGLRKKYNISDEMDHTEVEECWSTHKQVGTKMKGGKRVPNCVPKNEDNTEDKNDGSNTSGKNKSESRAVPKDKETDQPKKYVSGLSDKDKKAHDKHLEKGSKKADDDKSAYKQSPADKKAKTKPSKHTKKFKQMYGETKELLEFTKAQIKTLEKEYAPLKGRTMSTAQLDKMNGMIKRMSKDMLNKLAQASIPFVTSTAKSELVINRGMKWTDFKEAMKMPFKPKEKGEDKDAKIDKLEKENQMLKVKAEVEKMVEPNKDTGEVPLKVGLAQKILKDMKSGKKIKIKEKEGTKLKGIGLGKTKIEVDPEIDISPSAGGDPKTSHSQ